MGASNLSLALIAAAVPALAQTSDFEARLERHVHGVYVERRLALESAWDAASPGAQARARELLGRIPTDDAFMPSARTISGALRVLRGLAPATAVQRLVDSVDLRVMPGAFEPTDHARGEPVIVVVRGLYGTGLEEAEVSHRLRAVWVGPDGDEVLATTEMFHPRALRAGFELYVHAPRSRPGAWRLIPEIDGERGFGVRVECVLDLHDRVQASAERDVVLAVRHGVRDPLAPTVARTLDSAQRPVAAPVRGAAGAVLGWELIGEHEGSEPVVLIQSPEHAEPAWSFAGPRARAWGKLAAVAGTRIIATRDVARLARELRDGTPAPREIIGIVPPPEAEDLREVVDRLVILTSAGDVPAGSCQLVVRMGALEPSVSSEGGIARVAVTEPAALVDRVLPGWIARWLLEGE
ncbi:MAG: hypothetical protein GY711_33975 [bacterium]|nr:hypothetical protein [bacterium]